MRLPHVLLLLVASFLLASDVSSVTTDQVSNGASPTNPNQRLLRAHNTAIESDTKSEERDLTPDKMKKMMKAIMTKEDYAAKLGISDQIKNAYGGNLVKLMQTHKYDKYRSYMDFLNDMMKVKKYKKLVEKIKAKSKNQ